MCNILPGCSPVCSWGPPGTRRCQELGVARWCSSLMTASTAIGHTRGPGGRVALEKGAVEAVCTVCILQVPSPHTLVSLSQQGEPDHLDSLTRLSARVPCSASERLRDSGSKQRKQGRLSGEHSPAKSLGLLAIHNRWGTWPAPAVAAAATAAGRHLRTHTTAVQTGSLDPGHCPSAWPGGRSVQPFSMTEGYLQQPDSAQHTCSCWVAHSPTWPLQPWRGAYAGLQVHPTPRRTSQGATHVACTLMLHPPTPLHPPDF